MPNWNFNFVVIDAPLREVKKYLVSTSDDKVMFNMNKLFSNKFPSNDKAGLKNWNYDWAVENTGTKWFPSIGINCIAEVN